MDNVDENLIVLEGNKEVVETVVGCLREIGMEIPNKNDLEIFIRKHGCEYVFEDEIRSVKGKNITDNTFLPKRDKKLYSIDASAIAEILNSDTVQFMISSGTVGVIITSVVNAIKSEGEIEIDEKGNVKKIRFKGMSVHKAQLMVKKITEAIKKSNGSCTDCGSNTSQIGNFKEIDPEGNNAQCIERVEEN
ncbi:MAG: hypothetical protein LIO87_10500 [Eubacterium sp.]|nr:hypothetical protein [Eubacterium sp.]MCC8173961.1 hypothetical protein [Odoribacter sp.]